ncbi:MAG TPA: acyl carrier protein [Rhodanobacteraceae bacterium]|nr:acyl carrier protein [Rhodanobacteraceae bacterium]
MITRNEFREAVIQGIKRVKSIDHVDLANDENFSNAGLDSLDAMDLVLQVEAITGLNFGELNAAEANTIDAFYRKAEELFGNPD